jgi:hypothetical protein
VHATVDDKLDDTEDNFYGQLQPVFNQFLKYHMKLVSDFNAKISREYIFKPIIGNGVCMKLVVIMELEC